MKNTKSQFKIKFDSEYCSGKNSHCRLFGASNIFNEIQIHMKTGMTLFIRKKYRGADE